MTWSGNVRDLEAVVKNAFASSGNRITESSLQAPEQNELERKIGIVKARRSVPTHKELMHIFEDIERWAISRALALCEGKKGMAATMLDMNPNTLNYRLVKLKMETEELFWNKQKGEGEAHG